MRCHNTGIATATWPSVHSYWMTNVSYHSCLTLFNRLPDHIRDMKSSITSLNRCLRATLLPKTSESGCGMVANLNRINYNTTTAGFRYYNKYQVSKSWLEPGDVPQDTDVPVLTFYNLDDHWATSRVFHLEGLRIYLWINQLAQLIFSKHAIYTRSVTCNMKVRVLRVLRQLAKNKLMFLRPWV